MKSKLFSLLFFMVAIYGFAEPIMATIPSIVPSLNTPSIKHTIEIPSLGTYPNVTITTARGNTRATITKTTRAVETSKRTTSVSGLPYVNTNTGRDYAESIGSSELSSTILTDLCGSDFTDNGGPSGYYSSFGTVTTVLSPSIPGGEVTVAFSAFELFVIFPGVGDTLEIFDGPDSTSPSLGTFGGYTNPGSFTSTHPSGELTFEFNRISTNSAPGWIAAVTCAPPPCLAPASLSVSDITITSATLDWFGSATESIGYEWVVMANNVAPNTALAAATGTTTTEKTAAVSGLPSGSTYDAYVRTNCGYNIISAWSVVASFTTALPDYCGGDHFYDNGGPNGNYIPGPSYTTTIEPGTPDAKVRVTFLSFESLANYHFLIIYDGPDTSAPYLGDFSGTTNPGSFTSTHPSGALTFSFNPGPYILDVKPGWEAVVSCARSAPLNLASANISSTSADLSWDGEAAVNTGYEWVVMADGAAPDTTTAQITGTVGTGVLTAAIPGLTPDTNYDAYLRSEYGVDGKSFWSAIESFRTLVDFCGNNFYDSGGPSGNYPINDQQLTLILPSNVGDVVTVNFLSFDTELNYDDLRIYDGPDTSAPELGIFSGTTNPGSFTSTHPSGALFFVFDEDGGTTGPGWEAEVTCGPPPMISINSSNITSFTTCEGAASAEQSFIASGSQLTANLVVTPLPGFEVSTTSGTGFGATVSLTPASGIVSTTTIYIRLTSTATGTPSGDVTFTSAYVSTQNVVVSGTVNALPTVTFTTLADLCVDAGVQTSLGGATPTGGVYSGAGVIDGGDGSTYNFDPATAGIGVHTINYNYTNTSECSSSISDDIEVFEGQEIAFMALADPCVDAGMQTGLGGATPAGGVYSGPGVTDDGDGSSYSFNPATAGVGTHTITYTTDGSGGIGPIDQNQPDGSLGMTSWVADFDYAQSFISNESFICGAGIGLSDGGVTIELWNLLPNAGGTMLATGTVQSVTNGYADVQWPSVSITPGNLYYLVFIPTVFGQDVIGASDDNSSTNGWAFFGEGFTQWTTLDFKFRTYSCFSLCSIDATDTIEVFDVPAVTFTALADVLLNAGVQTGLGGASPSGGVYDGLGVTDDGNGSTYSFDPAVAGVGTHTLTYNFTEGNGCSNSASDDVEVQADVLGVDDVSLDLSNLTIYPNPATNVIIVNNPKNIPLKNVGIYDITGRLIKTMNTNQNSANEIEINISELESAIYFILINSEDTKIIRQIIKK